MRLAICIDAHRVADRARGTVLGNLRVQLPVDHDWAMLARSFSLLNFWVWFLAALGWKTWFRTGWGQALIVALLPSIVIYGVMALFAIL